MSVILNHVSAAVFKNFQLLFVLCLQESSFSVILSECVYLSHYLSVLSVCVCLSAVFVCMIWIRNVSANFNEIWQEGAP